MVKKRHSGKRGSVKSRSKQVKKAKKKTVNKQKKVVKKKKKVAKKKLKPATPIHKKPHKVVHHKHEEKNVLKKTEDWIKHEEGLLARKHIGKYKIPIGIRVLVVYMIFLCALYLASFLSTLSFPTTIIFGQVIAGTAAIVVNVIVLLSLILILYGLIRRKAYTFDLAIAWFGLAILNSLVSFFLMDSPRFAIFGNLLFLSFLTSVVVNTLVIWYILSEKKYFYARTFHDRPWHHKDKVFVYTLVSFWILVLLIGLSSAINFYGDTTRIVDQTMIELGSTHPFFIEEACLTKEGKERDVCLIVLATMYNTSDPEQVGSICSNIESDFFRFTCLRTLS